MYENKINSVTILFIFICFMFNNALGLECYVCKNQENNKDKCIETVKTCDISHDRCLSEVRWGSTPYWDPTGEKQFYISKTCSSKEHCNDAISNVTKRCDRIWYNDWECVECCNGDRCNYYVTLGAQQIHPGLTLIITTAVAFFIIKI